MSGLRLTADGASCTRRHRVTVGYPSEPISVGAPTSAPGAHGAMDWQPLGAQGNRQGDCP